MNDQARVAALSLDAVERRGELRKAWESKTARPLTKAAKA